MKRNFAKNAFQLNIRPAPLPAGVSVSPLCHSRWYRMKEARTLTTFVIAIGDAKNR